MIGQNESFKYLYDGHLFKSVIVMVGQAPKDFESFESYCALPIIYTQDTEPLAWHLGFLKGQKVQLIDGCKNDALFAKWYIHIKNLEPKSFLAMDSEQEIYVD